MIQQFDELPHATVQITGGLWAERRRLNREVAVPYQWEQLERVGTIDNFRRVAGDLDGERSGYFYTDSDAHKWAEAAAHVLATGEAPALARLLAEYTKAVGSAQAPDGYLYTFNQAIFPDVRWHNIQVEHELYCMGHLVEAGVAAGGELLEVARRAADLLVERFASPKARETPGHPELELALVRLYRLSGEQRYVDLARALVERRGRSPFLGLRLAYEAWNHSRRAKVAAKRRGDEEALGFDLSENLQDEEPPFLRLRAAAGFLSGEYLQQHRPVREMRVPVGHSVRWAYLATAATLLAQETDDTELLATMRAAWEHMVERRMYVTGGIGSLPLVEGFGRDWELDDTFAYCETCASLATISWCWELLRATGEARYADLIEWELYNGAAVGVGLEGTSYLYRNPLTSKGGLQRRPWFSTACCPSNVSRTWASLGRYVLGGGEALWVHQYIDASARIGDLDVTVSSGLPWEGRATITLKGASSRPVRLRLPGWCTSPSLLRDGSPVALPEAPPEVPTASGLPFHQARYVTLEGPWQGEHRLELDLPLTVRRHAPHPKLVSHQGMVAISRGPIVYCAESIDNTDVPDARLPSEPSPEPSEILGGVTLLRAGDLTLVPYYAWANRGESAMQVWLTAS